jgi:hypothetical protein
MNRISSQKSDNNSPAHKLTSYANHGHTFPVDSKSRQTAKLRGLYPINRRQYRHHDAGGFFSSVGCAIGYMPSLRGLQDGANRNKRVVKFRLSDRETWQFLPNSKTHFGAVIMTAITQGNIAHNSLARLPHVPFAPALPKHKAAPATIVFNKSRTGYIAYSKGTPLAWLVVGYHQGQLNNQPKRVEFVDVAWHRQHERGISMETAFFDTLTEAMQFIRTTFSKVGAA